MHSFLIRIDFFIKSNRNHNPTYHGTTDFKAPTGVYPPVPQLPISWLGGKALAKQEEEVGNIIKEFLKPLMATKTPFP